MQYAELQTVIMCMRVLGPSSMITMGHFVKKVGHKPELSEPGQSMSVKVQTVRV